MKASQGALAATATVLISLALPAGGAARAAAGEVRQVAIVGNSITRHGKAPKLDWPNDCGMAATGEDKDFAHLLFARIREKLAGKQDAEPELILPKGVVAEKDWSKWDPEPVKNADVLIIELGDNFHRPAAPAVFDAEIHFIQPYARMVKELRGDDPDRIVLCVSNWGDPGMPKWIAEGARRAGALYVEIAHLHRDPENLAASEGHFTNKSVNWHPGDRGMARIAETVWAALEPALDRRLEAAAPARP